MNQLLPYAGAFAAGILLGLLFFAGLWITIRNIDQSAHPALRLLTSLLLRLALVIAGFYVLAQSGTWHSLLLAGAGFMLARVLFSRRLRPPQRSHRDTGRRPLKKETAA